jgi:hypothetical protein
VQQRDEIYMTAETGSGVNGDEGRKGVQTGKRRIQEHEEEEEDSGSLNGDGGRKGVQTGKRKIRQREEEEEYRDEEEYSGSVTSRRRRKVTTKSYKRGGDGLWKSRGQISTSHQVHPMVGDFIASLSTISVKALNEGGHAIIQTLKDLVIGKEWADEVIAFQVDSLYSIATRCQQAEVMETSTQFVAMLNMLQLTSKLERFVVII